jgi:tetratricopeptide (TPR) repeat protein
MLVAILLFTTLAHTEERTVNEKKERFEPCDNTEQAKEAIVRIFNKKKISVSDSLGKIKYEEAKVYDDRIELLTKNGNKVFYFRDIFYFESPVEFVGIFEHTEPSAEEKKNNPFLGPLDFYSDEIRNIKYIRLGYVHWIASKTISTKYFDTHDLAQALSCIQQKLAKHYTDSINTDKVNKSNNEMAKFQEAANAYQQLTIKPAITEEQRKYIVQANALNNKKEYAEAIGLYNKALEINPVAYPAAYYNLALLHAQTNDFQLAIFNMKKYLLLVPDAPDARAAQDKIYEWEIETEKIHKE